MLPFILIALVDERNILAVALIVLAGLTDGLDGFFARYFNQVSNLGKALDPLADKVTFGAIAYFLVWLRGLPLWAVILIVSRDILILIAAGVLIRDKNIIVASNLYGKTAMVLLFFATLFYTMHWQELGFPVLLGTILLFTLSSISYAVRFGRLMRLEGDSVSEYRL